MNEFKKCPNGHLYQDSFESCPYCPKAAPNAAAGNPTEAFSSEKTQVFAKPAASPKQNESFHAEKTQVVSPGGSGTTGKPTSIRKLVGWLVTYDQNPNGKDFRLYEGRNTMGFNKDNDVVVDFDSSVSAKHLTILYRLGDFLFKDELSTNGTFLNGVLVNEGSLKDGDRLSAGNISFLFRTAQY